MTLEACIINENEPMSALEGIRKGAGTSGSRDVLAMPDLGSPTTSGVFKHMSDSSERQVAKLLLSVAEIVTKEIDSEGVNWEDDGADDLPTTVPRLPLRIALNIRRKRTSTLRVRNYSESSDEDNADGEEEEDSPATTDSPVEWNRVRTVSIDDPAESAGEDSIGSNQKSTPIVSPLNSPVTRKLPIRKSTLRALSRKRSVRLPTTTSGNRSTNNKKRLLQPNGIAKGQPVKTILRKKFSWKNYPEVSFKEVLLFSASLQPRSHAD